MTSGFIFIFNFDERCRGFAFPIHWQTIPVRLVCTHEIEYLLRCIFILVVNRGRKVPRVVTTHFFFAFSIPLQALADYFLFFVARFSFRRRNQSSYALKR